MRSSRLGQNFLQGNVLSLQVLNLDCSCMQVLQDVLSSLLDGPVRSPPCCGAGIDAVQCDKFIFAGFNSLLHRGDLLEVECDVLGSLEDGICVERFRY